MRSRPKAHERQCAAAVDPYIEELFVRPPLPWGYHLKQGDHVGLLHSFGEISGWRCFWRVGWRVKANQQRGPHQGALVITSSNFHGVPSLVLG